jgi:hypothetical protein
MAKFTSIWGDLNVGHVKPKEEDKKDPPKDPPEDPKGDETIQTGDPNVSTDDTDPPAGDPPAADPAPTAKTDPPKAGDPPAEPEYDEDEIERAYNLLIDEGVLPEPKEGEEFDVSPAGLADGVAASVRSQVAAELAAIPDTVQQYYAHVMEGNDPKAFKPSVPINWDEINLEEDGNKETALLQFYVNQGMTVDDAKEEIEDVKTAGKLDKKAEVARESLVTVQEANKTAKVEKEAKAKAAADKKANDEIAELKSTIDSSKSIAGFDLDDKRKAAFKEYLFKVKPRTGKTQMQENMASEDRRMNIAFLDFVNYNKEDLKKEVTTDLTKTRRKKLARYTDKGVTGSNSSKSVTTKVDTKKGKVAFPTIFGSQSIEVED